MIRRGRWKFVHSPADPDQLYDIAADPDETLNHCGKKDTEAVLATFRAEAAQRWDFKAIDEAVRDSQRRRRIVAPALMTGRITPWDYQPFRDASKAYMRNTMALGDLERTARFPRVGRP
jgi:choline-sulfatase